MMEVIDVEGLRRISGYDEDFVTEILKLYIERSTRDVSEILAARENKDNNTLKFIVHRMRSSAVPLGLKDLVVLLKKVEMGLEADQNADIDDELDAIVDITQMAIANAKNQLNSK